MLACTEIITLIHHIAGETGDSYESSVLSPASWFARRGITASRRAWSNTRTEGAVPANEFEVRIMTREDIGAKPGDYVARGVPATAVTSPKDLGGTEHFRVTEVRDNRRGILPHWRLSGS